MVGPAPTCIRVAWIELNRILGGGGRDGQGMKIEDVKKERGWVEGSEGS